MFNSRRIAQLEEEVHELRQVVCTLAEHHMKTVMFPKMKGALGDLSSLFGEDETPATKETGSTKRAYKKRKRYVSPETREKIRKAVTAAHARRKNK